MATISIAGLGISASDIHEKGKKHLLKSPAKSQLRIQLESASVSKPVNQSSITSFITKEETVKTEKFVGRLTLE